MSGYCECGCGQRTPLAPKNERARGWVKGQPIRFVYGHYRRSDQAGHVEQACGYGTPCWLWQGARDKNGYGVARARSPRMAAHRLYYERAYGPVPEGLQLDHLCRVPLCVNPEHLEPVTSAENTRRGAQTKITAADALEIARSNERNVDLASRFGIAASTVCNIRKGRIWRDVTGVAA